MINLAEKATNRRQSVRTGLIFFSFYYVHVLSHCLKGSVRYILEGPILLNGPGIDSMDLLLLNM